MTDNRPHAARVLGHMRVDPLTAGPVSRRAVLQGAALGGAALLTSCSTSGSARAVTHPGSPRVGAHPSSEPPPAAWRAFEAGLDGDLVRPGDSDYSEAKELFNPRWDGYRPLAVVEATTPEDVSESIRFARKYGLQIRPKAGGHSYVGASSATGVIDAASSGGMYVPQCGMLTSSGELPGRNS